MGSGLNGANLTCFWDGGERLSPPDSGNRFEDQCLGDFPHFPHNSLHPLVVLDGLEHLCRLLRGQRNTGGFAFHFERPTP
jgi:hypothetical protein